jgi:hypothetical protein
MCILLSMMESLYMKLASPKMENTKKTCPVRLFISLWPTFMQEGRGSDGARIVIAREDMHVAYTPCQ